MNADAFFLRPYWLLALIPLIGLIALSARRMQASSRSAWHKVVDPQLLKRLTVKPGSDEQSRWRVAALSTGLLAVVVALAGPTWEKNELPVFKPRVPTVLALSLSQSMNATDLSPDRLTRAGHKLRDILADGKGGDFGFIIYADRPFVAAPLTSDTRVITQMLPELSTSLMPVLGNHLYLAIDKAKDLLEQTGAHKGHVVVIADDAGADPAKSLESARVARQAGYRVSVLGVGTNEGAALQTASGAPIKSRSGEPALTRLAETELRDVAAAGGGVFVTLSPGSEDVDALSHTFGEVASTMQQADSQFHADAWKDMGYWLLIIPVLLAPLAFRKNVLMGLLPFGLCVPMQDASAATWDDLWKTSDQQGAENYRNGQFAAAADSFENPSWKASALYKGGQYGRAAALYASAETPDDYYNLGNAFAKAGEFEKAIESYDEALQLSPADADIRFNRDLVAQLLEDKKRKEQQESQDQQGGEKPEQSQGGDKPDQSQGGDKPERSQGGDQAEQSQSGGKPDQSEGGGKPEHQQAGAGQNPDERSDAEDVAPGSTQDQGPEVDTKGKSAFSRAMDALLEGNGGGQHGENDPHPKQPPAAAGLSELDQANEQQLRAVPDDPSGLLRARIRQHYGRVLPRN